MSEVKEEQEKAENKPRSSVFERMKRVVIALVLLVIFVPIFGQRVPQLLFGIKNTPVEKSAEKTIAEKASPPESKQEDKLVDKIPSVVVEKPEETTKPSTVVIDDSVQGDERVRLLEEQLKQLEDAKDKAKKQADNMVSSVVIIGQLQEAWRNGEPYSEQLDMLKNLAVDNSEVVAIIAGLSSASEHGVVAQTELVKEFSQLLRLALSGDDSGWFKKLLHKFITIRKVGDRVGDDDESIIARVEVNLAQGKLRMVLKELNNLSSFAKEVFGEWIGKVEVRLEMQENLDKLQMLLIESEPAKVEVFQP